jgi:hypothetical protein
MGLYSHKFIKAGAKKVVAVNISKVMIESTHC